MQPNQPSSPVPDPNQNPIPSPQNTPAHDPWTVAPTAQQPPATPTQSAPSDPYRTPMQPPVQSQPIEAPAFQRTVPADPYQAIPQPQPAQPVVASPQPVEWPQAQQPIAQNDTPVMTPPPVPAPVSPFQQQYEAALSQPAKSKLPLKMIGFIIAGLLVLGSGATAFLWWQGMNDPQVRLYRALENHMRTSYIHQDYDMKTNPPIEIGAKFQADSDFSNPAKPKSYIDYQMTIKGENEDYEQDGEVVVLDQDSYYAKLNKMPATTGMMSEYAPKLNIWHKVGDDDSLTGMVLDPVSSRMAINTAMGQILVGNFEEQTRAELMRFIKERDVYPISSSKSVDLAGQKTTYYTIDLEGDLVKELNEKAAKALNIAKDKEESSSDDMKLELWINNETSRIVQAKVESKVSSSNPDDSKPTGSNMITLSYPTDVSRIKKPENIQPLPWEE